MSTWPGSTYATNKSIRKLPKYIRKGRYLGRPSVRRSPAISRKIFGKSTVVKMTYCTSGACSAIADWDTVYGLVAVMQASPDWASYRDSYALMNILNCTVHVYPQAFAFATGIDRIAGVCYDTKDNIALASIDSLAQHNQHKIMPFNTLAPAEYIFSARCKATRAVPQSTAVNTETWGYIKAFGDNANFTNASICKLEFNITVALSAEQ